MPGVLTKKQCWRRQAVMSNRRSNDADKINIVMRSLSESSLPHTGYSVLGSRKQWSTMNDLQSSSRCDVFGSKKKSVMFSARVHVVLIPCITEYETAGLANLMWWTDEDYKLFKKYALEEVKEFMLRFKIMDSKEAIRRLYQHSDETTHSLFHDDNAVKTAGKPYPASCSDEVQCQPKLHKIDDDHLPSCEHKESHMSAATVSPVNNNPVSTHEMQDLLPIQLYHKSPGMCKYPSHPDDSKATDEKNLNFRVSNEPIHPLALMCL